MKLTQNQFYGKTDELGSLPYGSTFLDTDTGKLHYTDTNGVQQISSNVNKTDAESNHTSGILIQVNKESLAGSSWGSKVKALEGYAIGNSTERIAEVVGSQTGAKHIGSGESYFIVGNSTSAIHEGSGNTGGMYGVNTKSLILGTGIGDHGYVIGVNAEAKLDNPNATVDYLQGQHLSVELKEGDVTGALTVQLVDFDYTGAGVVSGDFAYVQIQNDNLPSVGGTARAIYCKSILPSEFGGSVQVAGLINSAVAEYADNAAAVTAGLAIGTQYRTGDLLKIVH